MADIFISYAREDQSRIQPIVKALEAQGWTVFWDRTIPAGKTWREVIGDALDNARSIIVAWSKSSVNSRWVQEESDLGLERKILIPILIDNVKPPLGFGSIQAADLIGWKPTDSSPKFEKLMADLSAILGPPLIDVGKADQELEKEEFEVRRKAEQNIRPKENEELEQVSDSEQQYASEYPYKKDLKLEDSIQQYIFHPKENRKSFFNSRIKQKMPFLYIIICIIFGTGLFVGRSWYASYKQAAYVKRTIKEFSEQVSILRKDVLAATTPKQLDDLYKSFDGIIRRLHVFKDIAEEAGMLSDLNNALRPAIYYSTADIKNNIEKLVIKIREPFKEIESIDKASIILLNRLLRSRDIVELKKKNTPIALTMVFGNEYYPEIAKYFFADIEKQFKEQFQYVLIQDHQRRFFALIPKKMYMSYEFIDFFRHIKDIFSARYQARDRKSEEYMTEFKSYFNKDFIELTTAFIESNSTVIEALNMPIWLKNNDPKFEIAVVDSEKKFIGTISRRRLELESILHEEILTLAKSSLGWD